MIALGDKPFWDSVIEMLEKGTGSVIVNVAPPDRIKRAYKAKKSYRMNTWELSKRK